LTHPRFGQREHLLDATLKERRLLPHGMPRL
jgi:hypothetical protein